MGLQRLAQMVQDGPDVSNYYINGFARARTPVLHMIAVLGLSAQGAEAALLSLLEDDRFLMKVDKMHQDLQDDLVSLSRIPWLVWQRLSSWIPGIPSQRLKHDTLTAAAASFAYIEREVFSSVRTGILSLAQGDIPANVRRLQEGVVGQECQACQKLLALLALGELVAHVEQALRLLQQVPCTSTLVEEGHASGAMIKKHHKHIGEPQLRARQLLHQMRALLTAIPIETRLLRVQRSRGALQ